MTADRDYMAEHRAAQARIDAMATEMLSTLEQCLALIERGETTHAKTLIKQVLDKARGLRRPQE